MAVAISANRMENMSFQATRSDSEASHLKAWADLIQLIEQERLDLTHALYLEMLDGKLNLAR